MSHKNELREQRIGMIINDKSEKREGKIARANLIVSDTIRNEFKVNLKHSDNICLHNIIDILKTKYPNVEFHIRYEKSSMRPDGGVFSLVDGQKKEHVVLITEMKNQGTNDLRAKEGKKKQAQGNAIERLGKNVIGFRMLLINEDIFPFVCFGDGCDFTPDSPILDRVSTISMFAPLNKIHVHKEGSNKKFDRGSFFFREKPSSPGEMSDIMLKISRISIEYYFNKYGKEKL